MSEVKSPSSSVDRQALATMYRALVLPRLVEERMLLSLRQGIVSKWFSGIGQEAISVGVALALNDDEYILPLHRNLGVFTTRGVPLRRLFCQFQGKELGFTKGRDRSFHFGSLEYHIVGMISHLGPMLGVADGLALASKLNGEKKVTLVHCGDGTTSEGDFHEALNVAAVWKLPVIFLIENNGYGLSTPASEQFACKKLSDRAIGYGMKGLTIDGNNLLEVYDTIVDLAALIRRKPAPILLECNTFRMRGHEEASGTKYVPEKLFEKWGKKDPIMRFEKALLEQKIMTQSDMDAVRSELSEHIEEELDAALNEPSIVVDIGREIRDVFHASSINEVLPQTGTSQELRLVDAISSGLRTCLQRSDKVLIMGQDIAEYGGVFKITEGFVEEFGRERIRNTPLCESAILGAALGLSLRGYKPIVEMQFADFVSSGYTQVINNIAKTHYRWGGRTDVLIRMPTGAGVAAGPFHSQSTEAWFCHTAGLKVVYPAFPYDAKGLIISAVEEENPVMFFEHKALYRSIRGSVPDGYYRIEIGKANLVNEGTDATIITYGLGVHWALDLVQRHPEVSLHILDLRTLSPLDKQAISEAVWHTGRVLLLQEASENCGIMSEVSAFISEECFECLDAPVVRCSSLDTPVPFARALEDVYLASSRLDESLLKLLEY